jgi:hypothetical protein
MCMTREMTIVAEVTYPSWRPLVRLSTTLRWTPRCSSSQRSPDTTAGSLRCGLRPYFQLSCRHMVDGGTEPLEDRCCRGRRLHYRPPDCHRVPRVGHGHYDVTTPNAPIRTSRASTDWQSMRLNPDAVVLDRHRPPMTEINTGRHASNVRPHQPHLGAPSGDIEGYSRRPAHLDRLAICGASS